MRRLTLLTSDLRLRCHPERSEGSAFHSVFRLLTSSSWLLTSVFFLLTSLFCLLTPALSPAQGVTPQSIITTVAGGSWVFRGDGKPAIDAPLGESHGVAVDSARHLYAADNGNHMVVRVSPEGILTVVAGNGIPLFSGDGGLATSASLNEPRGVALDVPGNLYIADLRNHRVRKVSPDGVIRTVAGNGRPGFSGDGGPATSASLWDPTGVAIDSLGNIYIADNGNHRVRKVNPNGIITTVARDGFTKPDGSGRFSGDGGQATSASLNFPQGVVVDGANNLYIGDRLNRAFGK